MGTPTTDGTRDGFLLVDKPAGLTSHDVVARVRRAVGERRVGHTGTLDPFATGLLVVLTGRGTRLIPYVDGEPKVYEATIRFGVETDTDDATGQATRSAPPPADDAITRVIPLLTGAIDQVPPSYSAKKIAGARAYDAARRGAPLALAAVRVAVHGWTVLERDRDDLRVRIACGAGTYVRALGRDLGRLTGSAAHLTMLRRTASGPFRVDDAVPADALSRDAVALRPLRDAVPSLPARALADDELARVVHGNPLALEPDACAQLPPRIALVDASARLVAVAECDGAALRPRVVLRDA